MHASWPASKRIRAEPLDWIRRGSSIEFVGTPDFTSGAGPAVARPSIDIGGVRHELSDVPIAWERASGQTAGRVAVDGLMPVAVRVRLSPSSSLFFPACRPHRESK
jgi:hypothetical protein